MNEEIKEIFNEIKHLVEISNYEEHYHLNDYFEVEHIAKLLNYTTNLQEENEFLKDYKIAYENVMTANKMLEKENQKLVKVIDELEKWLKERLDKLDLQGFDDDVYDALEIVLNKLTELKGGSDD